MTCLARQEWYRVSTFRSVRASSGRKCPPVSVGQEADVGVWLGKDRSAAYRALLVCRRVRLSTMVPVPINDRARFGPCNCPDAQGGRLQHQTIQWAILKYWLDEAFISNSPAMMVEKHENLSQKSNALNGSNSSRAQMWTVAQARSKVTLKSLRVSTETTMWPLKLTAGMAQLQSFL